MVKALAQVRDDVGPPDRDDGNPSPDAYHIAPQHSVTEFVIKPDTQSNNMSAIGA
jgi:hypothetical protein